MKVSTTLQAFLHTVTNPNHLRIDNVTVELFTVEAQDTPCTVTLCMVDDNVLEFPDQPVNFETNGKVDITDTAGVPHQLQFSLLRR